MTIQRQITNAKIYIIGDKVITPLRRTRLSVFFSPAQATRMEGVEPITQLLHQVATILIQKWTKSKLKMYLDRMWNKKIVG